MGQQFVLLVFFALLIVAPVAAEEQIVADRIKPQSAGCLLFKGNKVLVLEHERELFSFPGGRLDEGELPEDAARRETLEEVGVKVQVRELLHQFEDGYALFFCVPDRELEKGMAVPASGKEEVQKVSFKKCKNLKRKSWRAENRFDQVKKLCKRHSRLSDEQSGMQMRE